jgi:hypothetical protein
MGDPLMFDNKEPISVGMRVRVDHPTSRLHGETGTIKKMRDNDAQALFESEQFPQCDPVWFDVRCIKPIPKEANDEVVPGGDRQDPPAGDLAKG